MKTFDRIGYPLRDGAKCTDCHFPGDGLCPEHNALALGMFLPKPSPDPGPVRFTCPRCGPCYVGTKAEHMVRFHQDMLS